MICDKLCSHRCCFAAGCFSSLILPLVLDFRSLVVRVWLLLLSFCPPISALCLLFLLLNLTFPTINHQLTTINLRFCPPSSDLSAPSSSPPSDLNSLTKEPTGFLTANSR